MKAEIKRRIREEHDRYGELLWSYYYNLRREFAYRILSDEELLACDEEALTIERNVAMLSSHELSDEMARITSAFNGSNRDDPVGLAYWCPNDRQDFICRRRSLQMRSINEEMINEKMDEYKQIVFKMAIISRTHVEYLAEMHSKHPKLLTPPRSRHLYTGTDIERVRERLKAHQGDRLKEKGLLALKRATPALIKYHDEHLYNSPDPSDPPFFDDEEFEVRYLGFEVDSGVYGITLKTENKFLIVRGSYGDESYGMPPRQDWYLSDPSFGRRDTLLTNRMTDSEWDRYSERF
ncbi:MAG: hypothetical protein IT485_00245 [Gammaproteobacteria bacterium]|nr:hypothetical protein [Gammaproteobacteria bacterium]